MREMERNTDSAVATKVSLVSIAGNMLLTAFKLIAGVLAHSGAMISDAVHSASDVLSSLIVVAGVRIAAKAPDEGHPYGHERFECVAAMILAAVLALVGGGIGVEAVRKIAGKLHDALPGRDLADHLHHIPPIANPQYYFGQCAMLSIKDHSPFHDNIFQLQ